MKKSSKEMKDFHCKNKRCQAVLCKSDGEFIYFQTTGFAVRASANRIEIPCEACRYINKWYRNLKNND